MFYEEANHWHKISQDATPPIFINNYLLGIVISFFPTLLAVDISKVTVLQCFAVPKCNCKLLEGGEPTSCLCLPP